jgi:t-SNARE complex subunit (syntaxin)
MDLDKKHEKIIFNKVNSVELDKKYSNDLDNLLSDVREINEISSEMNSLLKSQNEKIDQVDKSLNQTSNNIDSSNGQLIIASEYNQSIFWKKSFLLTLCVGIVSAPVAALVGAKAAIFAGVGTLVGGAIKIY